MKHILKSLQCPMLNLSPLVGECVGGVRFIDPNFEVTLGTLRSTMSKEYIRRKLEDSNTIDALLQEANGATHRSGEKGHKLLFSGTYIQWKSTPLPLFPRGNY